MLINSNSDYSLPKTYFIQVYLDVFEGFLVSDTLLQKAFQEYNSKMIHLYQKY